MAFTHYEAADRNYRHCYQKVRKKPNYDLSMQIVA